ncbi:MAG: thiamine phosphate synthase [Bacteroidota bacterium]
MLPRLHIITNTTLQSRFSHFELAKMAFSTGKCAVQYRNKAYLPDRDRAELEAIAALARRSGLPLIINDDAELAFQVGAQGVHLGKEDGSVAAARALLGPKAIIGATVHDPSELAALTGQAINYVGIGPVYGTRSKSTGLPDLGLSGLRTLVEISPWPVIAIGSIETANLAPVVEAGAYGCAVISSFGRAENPVTVAKTMLDILPD